MKRILLYAGSALFVLMLVVVGRRSSAARGRFFYHDKQAFGYLLAEENRYRSWSFLISDGVTFRNGKLTPVRIEGTNLLFGFYRIPRYQHLDWDLRKLMPGLVGPQTTIHLTGTNSFTTTQ